MYATCTYVNTNYIDSIKIFGYITNNYYVWHWWGYKYIIALPIRYLYAQLLVYNKL